MNSKVLRKKRKKLKLINKISQILFKNSLKVLDGRFKIYMSLYIIYLKFIGVRVEGIPKYISSDLKIDSSDYEVISIGNNVVISSEVRLLTHDYSVDKALEHLSYKSTEVRKILPITIQDDSFIGLRCTILPGVIVGKGSIIGSGSIVTKNVEEYTVVAGNPAKKINTIENYYKKVINDYEKSPQYFYAE